jgi:type IV secretion system protein VirB8
MDSTIENTFESNQVNSQKPPSKAVNNEVSNYLSEMKKFEEDRVELAKESAKTAWKVATGFGLLALMAVCAVITLTPLKTIENYMTIIDPQTGIATVLKPIADAEYTTYGEILDKYWVQRFIIERNSYEWETIQNSYNTVELMSNDKVFNTYAKLIRAADSPLEIFGDKKAIRVKVNGISFLPQSSDSEILAQVSFTRQVVSNDGANAIGFEPTFWTATLTFDYGSAIKTEQDRALNPLGFQVLSYREDMVTVK